MPDALNRLATIFSQRAPVLTMHHGSSLKAGGAAFTRRSCNGPSGTIIVAPDLPPDAGNAPAVLGKPQKVRRAAHSGANSHPDANLLLLPATLLIAGKHLPGITDRGARAISLTIRSSRFNRIPR